MKTITSLKVERSQSGGQLQRPFSIESTPLLVMSGAMDVSSMKYGHLDTSLSMTSTMPRFVLSVDMNARHYDVSFSLRTFNFRSLLNASELEALCNNCVALSSLKIDRQSTSKIK